MDEEEAGNGNGRDTIHVSPWLVKILASSILGGLGLIGVYMIQWNASDAAFKERVILSLNNLEQKMSKAEILTQQIPTNTQKLSDHDRRIERIEDHIQTEHNGGLR